MFARHRAVCFRACTHKSTTLIDVRLALTPDSCTALAAHNERQKITFSTRRGERVYSRKCAFHVLPISTASYTECALYLARANDGRPPGRLIIGAASPTTVAVRKSLKSSENSIDSSPLGRPDVAEHNAFPYDPRSASASVPSIRWKATARPSASQTITLMLTARLCALARAAWMARFASASLIDMSFA